MTIFLIFAVFPGFLSPVATAKLNSPTPQPQVTHGPATRVTEPLLCPYQTTVFNDVIYQLRLAHLRIFPKNDSTFRSVNYLWAGNGGYIELWMNLAKHTDPHTLGLKSRDLSLVRLNIIIVNLDNGSPGWSASLGFHMGWVPLQVIRIFFSIPVPLHFGFFDFS